MKPLITYVKAQWDRVGAWVLIAVGFVTLVVGWLGISGTTILAAWLRDRRPHDGILLPLEAIDWDDAALRATLAHEAQHIREGDFYLQLAATLHHCFFWISPHAWWLRPQLSRLSETICDRAAIASSGDGLSYAQLLIRFASAERTPEGMLAMAQSAGLRERVERLIADPQLTGAFRQRRGQAIVAGALLAMVAIVAAVLDVVQRPDVELALFALGIGVERGRKRPFGGHHLALEPADRFLRTLSK